MYQNLVFFLYSDEEGEPSDSLWYLPVAPDVDDPEEPPVGFVLPPENQQASSSTANSQNIPPAKKSPTIIDVSLPTPKYSSEGKCCTCWLLFMADCAHCLMNAVPEQLCDFILDPNSLATGRKKTPQPRQKRKNKNIDADYK